MFLQAEFKGQENLKADLVRRVKMLEYALVQERKKNFELKYPNEKDIMSPSRSPPNGTDYFDNGDHSSSFTDKSNGKNRTLQWREERDRLRE